MIVIDVVSVLMRPSPSPAVIGWVRVRSESELYTTSITLAEIRYGIERLPDGRRKELLRTTAADVFAAFEEQVLPFDAKATARYATIVSDRDNADLPIDGFDAQIASICRTHQAALATRNVKDFQDTGIDVIDPWQHRPVAAQLTTASSRPGRGRRSQPCPRISSRCPPSAIYTICWCLQL